ncbi:hypothetical protein EYF80_013702 [Liparis tanakae]|uniref:Uncharacterized protein n=1 Tax=Liparis tanakae TaxID=230148 RepID=A0A4Z2IEI1_9TELE|nr:hypothetical protein EYF80_013702 [Liparis tanakae]
MWSEPLTGQKKERRIAQTEQHFFDIPDKPKHAVLTLEARQQRVKTSQKHSSAGRSSAPSPHRPPVSCAVFTR